MERVYHDIVTFLGGLEPLVKGLIVGLLVMCIALCMRQIVKTHVNSSKKVFKIGQFILLIILVAITVFICVHLF